MRDILKAQFKQFSLMSPAPCWLAKVRMIPPCVPQVVRLDSKDFHLLNDLTPQSQCPWTHYVQQADSELVSIMILWPIHFCLLSAVLGYSCEHPTRLGNILITTDYNLHSIKHDYRVSDAAQLAQHAPSSGFAPQHQIKGKGGSEVKAVGRVSPAWAVWEPVCMRACLCTFTRVFS